MSIPAIARGSGDRLRPGAAGAQAAAAGWSAASRLLSLPILAYRWLISPLLGPRCRYLPTCSDYALDALRLHGAGQGGLLAVRRLARCHPWGGSGFDPVPAIISDPTVARPAAPRARCAGRH